MILLRNSTAGFMLMFLGVGFFSITTCYAQEIACKLLNVKPVAGLPSSSAIVLLNDRLFIAGDDSRNVMILDVGYRKVDSIKVFDSQTFRIAKETKADIESMFVWRGLRKRIVLVGSGSTDQRKRSIFFGVSNFGNQRPIEFDNTEIFGAISDSLGTMNVEGALQFKRFLILGNRQVQNSSGNFLVTVGLKSFLTDSKGDISFQRLIIPDSVTSQAGISDLSFVKRLNTLLITFSTEETPDAVQDGKVGDSYLGWIVDFSRKRMQNDIRLDGMINLSEVHPEFISQKIEGVCMEKRSGRRMILHLVSDNDDGKSRIFKVEFHLPE